VTIHVEPVDEQESWENEAMEQLGEPLRQIPEAGPQS
jgi:hypothetical protein